MRVDGELNLGRNVWFNCNTLISVHEKVVIDNDFVSGWNLLIMDSDNHKVYCDNKLQVDHAPIVIHEKVWAAANVSILKGVSVGTGSIVAYGSIVTSNCLEEYCLYAGIPARKKKSNISWDI